MELDYVKPAVSDLRTCKVVLSAPTKQYFDNAPCYPARNWRLDYRMQCTLIFLLQLL